MNITSIDIDEIYEEFGEVLEKIHGMISRKSKNLFCRTIQYLEVGIFELSADDFANFIADLDDNFVVIKANLGDGLFKVNNVYVVLSYTCEWEISTTIRAKVFEALDDAEKYYASV